MAIDAPVCVLYAGDAGLPEPVVERTLIAAGYEVDCVADGIACLATYDAERHEVLILEKELPGKSGLDVVEALVAEERLPPTIMLAGAGDEETAAAMKLGISDYLIKDAAATFLRRLPRAIEIALREQQLREDCARTQAELAITLRKLSQQKALARQAEKVVHFGSWITTIETGEITWSDELYRLYGLDPNDAPAIEECMVSQVHPDDRKTAERTLAQRLKTGESCAFELRVVRPDGEVRWVRARQEALPPSQGAPRRIVGVMRDITDEVMVREGSHRPAASRALVGQMLRHLRNRGGLTDRVMFETGRDMAGLVANTTHRERTDWRTYLAAYANMGLGALNFVERSFAGDERTGRRTPRWSFSGFDLVEVIAGEMQPTCHFARGYLCGVISNVLGGEAIGVETECQSAGDAHCTFIIQPRNRLT